MCWSDAITTTIFAGHQIVFDFSLLQPMLCHSNQISYDDRGLFILFIESNLYNYGDPSNNEQKSKRSSFHNIMRLWFSGNFIDVVNPELPL